MELEEIIKDIDPANLHVLLIQSQQFAESVEYLEKEDFTTGLPSHLYPVLIF